MKQICSGVGAISFQPICSNFVSNNLFGSRKWVMVDHVSKKVFFYNKCNLTQGGYKIYVL